jgi:hypothetical protein
MTAMEGPWQVFGTELLDKLGMVITLTPGAQKYSRADSLAGETSNCIVVRIN